MATASDCQHLALALDVREASSIEATFKVRLLGSSYGLLMIVDFHQTVSTLPHKPAILVNAAGVNIDRLLLTVREADLHSQVMNAQNLSLRSIIIVIFLADQYQPDWDDTDKQGCVEVDGASS